MIIYPKHIYSTQVNGRILCASGARRWFAEHGLSWSSFVANGIDCAIVLAIGDVFGLAVVQTAQDEEAGGTA